MTQRIPKYITTKCISDFQVLFWVNEKPLQDAAHALLLQKPVHDSIFFARILPVTGDGIQHVFTLLGVEMVRGILMAYLAKFRAQVGGNRGRNHRRLSPRPACLKANRLFTSDAARWCSRAAKARTRSMELLRLRLRLSKTSTCRQDSGWMDCLHSLHLHYCPSHPIIWKGIYFGRFSSLRSQSA